MVYLHDFTELEFQFLYLPGNLFPVPVEFFKVFFIPMLLIPVFLVPLFLGK